MSYLYAWTTPEGNAAIESTLCEACYYIPDAYLESQLMWMRAAGAGFYDKLIVTEHPDAECIWCGWEG